MQAMESEEAVGTPAMKLGDPPTPPTDAELLLHIQKQKDAAVADNKLLLDIIRRVYMEVKHKQMPTKKMIKDMERVLSGGKS